MAIAKRHTTFVSQLFSPNKRELQYRQLTFPIVSIKLRLSRLSFHTEHDRKRNVELINDRCIELSISTLRVRLQWHTAPNNAVK